MRQFLDTPSFQLIRVIQMRKDFYYRNIAALEALLEEAYKNQAVLSGGTTGFSIDSGELEESRTENVRLEARITELTNTLTSANTRGTGATQRLTELENASAALRTQNASLEAAIAARDENIGTLRTENSTLTQTVTARDNHIRDLDARINTLDTESNTLRQRLQAILELTQ